MAEIEPAVFCSIGEYDRHINERIQAAELSIGGLYTAMALLRRRGKNKNAFKFPITLNAVNIGDVSTVLLVDLLDADLQPKQEVNITILDGIARNPGIHEVTTRKSVTELYLRDYEDYFDGDLPWETIEDEIPDNTLASV